MKALVIIEKDQNGYGAYTDNLTTVLHGSGPSVQAAKEELQAGYQELLTYYHDILIQIGKRIVQPHQCLIYKRLFWMIPRNF